MADETPRSNTRNVALLRTCPSCSARFPADRNYCPECRTSYERARGSHEDVLRKTPLASLYSVLDALLDKGVLGGTVLIGIAVLWFVLRLNAGYISFYPIFLAALGLGGIVAGLMPRKRGRRESARRNERGRRR